MKRFNGLNKNLIRNIKKGFITFVLVHNTFASLICADKMEETLKNYEMVEVVDNDKKIDPIINIEYDLSGEKDNEHVRKVHICLVNGDDYSFLNEMSNLEEIEIDDYRTLPIDEIDGSVFTKDINIIINNLNAASSFSEDKYSFLKDIDSIKRLYLTYGTHYNGSDRSGLNIESKFLESLDNIHILRLKVSDGLLYNYHDLKSLDRLELIGLPYDIAMLFSNEDLDELEAASVEVYTGDMEMVRKANNDIKRVVDCLNISPDASLNDKINAITSYIVNNYTYDPDVSEAIKNNTPHNNTKFYENGILTASLNSETQICGNYAAMFKALARSLGIEAYYVNSNNHAWNIVKTDDYYYIDPTFIDDDEIIVTETHEVYDPNLGDIPTGRILATTRKSVVINDALKVMDVDPKTYMTEFDLLSYSPDVIPIDVIKSNPELANARTRLMRDEKIYKKRDTIKTALLLYLISGGCSLMLIVDCIIYENKNKNKEKTLK